MFLCCADGGMSLLKHPSAAMSKLIQSAEKWSMKPGLSDKALQVNTQPSADIFFQLVQ